MRDFDRSYGGGGGGAAERPIPSDYYSQELFGPQIKRQERATSIKGASFSNSYKSSTDLTVGDIADSLNPVGSAYRDFLNPEGKEVESMEEKGDMKGKRAAQAGGRQQDPLVAAVEKIVSWAETSGILGKIDAKLPQHVLA